MINEEMRVLLEGHNAGIVEAGKRDAARVERLATLQSKIIYAQSVAKLPDKDRLAAIDAAVAEHLGAADGPE